MKIKATTSFFNSITSINAGEVKDVEKSYALDLIRAGYAVEVKEEKAKNKKTTKKEG